MKTAAAYIRVSDERQDEFSPDSQLKLIREYCDRNDIDLPEELVFYDDGISGKTVRKRNGFNSMIAMAKQKEKPFEIILVWKFSRFARNQEESIVYKSLLKKNGVEVISISEPLSDNPFGGLIERIIEWMDEYYLIRLSDEVRRGMTERATRGLPNVAPPYGYKMVNGSYKIIHAEAENVRKIFELFLDGNSIRSISTYLQSIGVKTKSGNVFDTRAVEYILNNPCYAGYIRWNPHGKSSSKRLFDNPDDILTKGAHDPIITEDAFNHTKELLAMRKKSMTKYARDDFQVSQYALKGLVRCDNCGATLVYNKSQNALQCHKYSKGLCDTSHYANLDTLNKMVLDALKSSVGALSFNIEVKPNENRVSMPIDYDALIHTEMLKLERAKQAYQEGVDSLNEYRATKEKIEQQIARYEKERSKETVRLTKADIKKYSKTVCDVIDLLECNDVSDELKNKALKAIIQKIIFYKEEHRVELFFYI